jgi:hypothetical protein
MQPTSNEPSLTDPEFLAGLAVLALAAAALAGAIVLLCRRCCRAKAPIDLRYIITPNHCATLDGMSHHRPSTICAKCRANPVTTIFADCGHSLVCPSCAHDIWKTERKCPVCHRPLDAVFHILGHRNYQSAEQARVEALVRE